MAVLSSVDYPWYRVKTNMSPVPRPHHSKYPTIDAFKKDEWYGSSYNEKESGHIHYMKERPHYVKHVRAMQRGTKHQSAQIRDLYQGQFHCGGWKDNEALVLPLANMPVQCPPHPHPHKSHKPICHCK